MPTWHGLLVLLILGSAPAILNLAPPSNLAFPRPVRLTKKDRCPEINAGPSIYLPYQLFVDLSSEPPGYRARFVIAHITILIFDMKSTINLFDILVDWQFLMSVSR